jgi:hypothetical protein
VGFGDADTTTPDFTAGEFTAPAFTALAFADPAFPVPRFPVADFPAAGFADVYSTDGVSPVTALRSAGLVSEDRAAGDAADEAIAPSNGTGADADERAPPAQAERATASAAKHESMARRLPFGNGKDAPGEDASTIAHGR